TSTPVWDSSRVPAAAKERRSGSTVSRPGPWCGTPSSGSKPKPRPSRNERGDRLDTLTEKLTQIFREVFDSDTLTLRDDMVASDVDGWDSLNHVKLVVAIETAFKMRFATREVVGWKNVGQMKKSLQAKVKA